MSKAPSRPAITNVTELFAIAYQIEADAVERYELLTRQMEGCNNAELTTLFADLAKAEAIHRDEIRRLAGDPDIEARGRTLAKWARADSPEQLDLTEMHYLTTPWQALQLALAGEKRALAFFQDVSRETTDPAIKKIADEFAIEEAEHVELVHRLLAKYAPPGAAWNYDPDPPVAQD
jgi:rubrerythrin